MWCTTWSAGPSINQGTWAAVAWLGTQLGRGWKLWPWDLKHGREGGARAGARCPHHHHGNTHLHQGRGEGSAHWVRPPTGSVPLHCGRGAAAEVVPHAPGTCAITRLVRDRHLWHMPGVTAPRVARPLARDMLLGLVDIEAGSLGG